MLRCSIVETLRTLVNQRLQYEIAGAFSGRLDDMTALFRSLLPIRRLYLAISCQPWLPRGLDLSN